MLGPQTKQSLIASPYALHKNVLATCPPVKGPKMLAEFLVDTTVLIVERGLAVSITKSPDAKAPSVALILAEDAPERPKHVHRHRVAAAPTRTTPCVKRSCARSFASRGKMPTTYPMLPTAPAILERVTYLLRSRLGNSC